MFLVLLRGESGTCGAASDMSLTSCRLTCPGDVGLDILEVLEVMGLDVLERRACEGLFRISGAGVAINVWLVKWVLKAWDHCGCVR